MFNVSLNIERIFKLYNSNERLLFDNHGKVESMYRIPWKTKEISMISRLIEFQLEIRWNQTDHNNEIIEQFVRHSAAPPTQAMIIHLSYIWWWDRRNERVFARRRNCLASSRKSIPLTSSLPSNLKQFRETADRVPRC